jgi:hypothetical protein
MSDELRERLVQLATAFCDAIERADRPRLGITFESFPCGSCGDASLLLAHFLGEHGFADVTYVLGERGQVNVDWTSHAWLRVDGFIVDITADQFPDMDQRVIVARDSPWHDTFEIEDEHVGDFTIYDAATVANLGRIYAVIIAALGG